jgi:hypothetical protein
MQRCLSIATAVANGCDPVTSTRNGKRLGSPLMSSRHGLHIIGPMRALVSSSGRIMVSLPLCFKL